MNDNDLIFRECYSCGCPLARYEGSYCSPCRADIDEDKELDKGDD